MTDESPYSEDDLADALARAELGSRSDALRALSKAKKAAAAIGSFPLGRHGILWIHRAGAWAFSISMAAGSILCDAILDPGRSSGGLATFSASLAAGFCVCELLHAHLRPSEPRKWAPPGWFAASLWACSMLLPMFPWAAMAGWWMTTPPQGAVPAWCAPLAAAGALAGTAAMAWAPRAEAAAIVRNAALARACQEAHGRALFAWRSCSRALRERSDEWDAQERSDMEAHAIRRACNGKAPQGRDGSGRL